MRPLLFALTAAFALGLTAGAQDAKKKDDKESSFKDRPPEITEVGGKGIEQWVKEIASKDPSKRETAMRTVLLFGPDKAYQAVPTLLQELKKHTDRTPIDLSVRLSGTTTLATILAGVKEPDPKHLKDGVAILRGFLKDNQVAVRHRAVQALPRLGPDSRAAVDDVIKLAADPDTWETRQAALQTLTVLAADPKAGPPVKVLNAVTRGLNDSSHQVRFAAVQALAVLGAPADAVARGGMVKTLEGVASRDADPSNRLWAHMAIMTVEQKITDDRLGAVAKMLRHDDAAVRLQAAQALSMAGPAATKVATPPLIAALTDADPAVVSGSIVALAQLGANSAIPSLRKLADDPMQVDTIKKAAADAIDHLQSAGKKKKAEMTK